MRYIKIIVPERLKDKVKAILKDYQAEALCINKPLETSVPDGILITANLKADHAQEVVYALKELGLGQKGHGSITLMPANITFSCKYQGQANHILSPLELYYKAFPMSKWTKITFIKLMLATIMGSVAIITHSIPTLIGAMIIAPLVDTAMASVIGIVLKDRELAFKGFKKEISCLGLIIFLAMLMGLFTDVSTIALWLEQKSLIVSALVAFIAGIAGGISIASGKDYQMIGVTIDVSLLIPAVLLGMSLLTTETHLISKSAILLIGNVCLLEIGGIIGLAYRIRTLLQTQS